jgi:hypothetical protein
MKFLQKQMKNIKSYFNIIQAIVTSSYTVLYYGFWVLLYNNKTSKILHVLFLVYLIAMVFLGLLHNIPILLLENWSHILTTYINYNNNIKPYIKLDITQLIISENTDDNKLYLTEDSYSEPNKGIFKE